MSEEKQAEARPSAMKEREPTDAEIEQAIADIGKRFAPTEDGYGEACVRAGINMILARFGTRPAAEPVKPYLGDTFEPTMSIYAQPGTVVRFRAGGGYPFEKESALKAGFVLNALYTVKRCDIGNSRTTVLFDEIPGHWNSCLFADVAAEPIQSSSTGEAERLGKSMPLDANLRALAKNPRAAIAAFGVEWAGWCASSALAALSRQAPAAPAEAVKAWAARVREQADHARKNAKALGKYAGHEAEARARELAALYLEETAIAMLQDLHIADLRASANLTSAEHQVLRDAIRDSAEVVAEPVQQDTGDEPSTDTLEAAIANTERLILENPTPERIKAALFTLKLRINMNSLSAQQDTKCKRCGGHGWVMVGHGESAGADECPVCIEASAAPEVHDKRCPAELNLSDPCNCGYATSSAGEPAAEINRLKFLVEDAKAQIDHLSPKEGQSLAVAIDWVKQVRDNILYPLANREDDELSTWAEGHGQEVFKVLHALNVCSPEAAAYWNRLYRDECQKRQDDAYRYGQKIQCLEVEMEGGDYLDYLAEKEAAAAPPETAAEWRVSIADLILHLSQWQAAPAGEASTAAWDKLQATINALATPPAEKQAAPSGEAKA